MKLRRRIVEHPFGTIKAWMGATHFLMKRLKNVKTEISLHVLAYNLKRVMQILGAGPLIAAMRTWSAAPRLAHASPQRPRVFTQPRPIADVRPASLRTAASDVTAASPAATQMWPRAPAGGRPLTYFPLGVLSVRSPHGPEWPMAARAWRLCRTVVAHWPSERGLLMLETYELYFQTHGPPRFEALTSRSGEHVMAAARRRLAEEGAKSVEVRQFGRLLFRLTA